MAAKLKIKKIDGIQYIGKWKGTNIPIYDVLTADGLNRIVGHAKHLYSSDTILYRGQCKLYEHLIPSIKHDMLAYATNETLLENALENMNMDSDFVSSFEWDPMIAGWTLYQKAAYESLLQHYGAKTNSVDFVDNHWTALWFALNEFNSSTATYSKRTTSKDIGEDYYIEFDPYYPPETLKAKKVIDELATTSVADLNDDVISRGKKFLSKEFKEKEFKYRCSVANGFIFLYAAETNVSDIKGIFFGNKAYTVDLRKCVPGTFLRPVSQHGWIVKGVEQSYDFDGDVIGILRLSVELMDRLLGNGELLSQNNFFPKPECDEGYKQLLSVQDGTKYYNGKKAPLLSAGMISALY